MRCRLGSLLAVIVLLGFDGSEAACRAGGEYRVTRPHVVGSLTLTETKSDAIFSSGTAVFNLYPKQACPVCSIGSRPLTGEYHAGPGYDECRVTVSVLGELASVIERLGFVGGRSAAR